MKIKLIPVTSDDLKDYNINHIGCPNIIIPFMNKSFFPTFIFAKTKDEIIQKIQNKNPLIIFNNFKKIPAFSLVPKNLSNESQLYYLRYWDTITSKDWEILRNNILEVETHNFLFDWDLSYYNDPIVEVFKEKQKKILETNKQYDEQEMKDWENLTDKKIKL